MLKMDLDNAVSEIRKHKAKLIAIQLPEGLKTRAEEIAREIEKKCSCRTFVFADPCFGACDLADEKAKNLGADLLVHFGHVKMIGSKMPVVYVPLQYEAKDVHKVAKKLIDELKNKKIRKVCLCGVAQFIGQLRELKKLLEKEGITCSLGKGNARIAEPGQVLGCNYSSVKAAGKYDAVVFLGDGYFHAIGISFETEKPIFIVNTLENKIETLKNQNEQFMRKRFALKELAKDAKNYAILVSTKKGQENMKTAIELEKKIRAGGKNAILLVSDLIRPDYYLGMGFDCFICTACPRIAYDDHLQFRAPVISMDEAIELFMKNK